ncbi:MAG: FG-GAP-like repeat-containing protein [Saprospiraceae bacterium]|nr:FG-GAP-like repeat-containing protein [Saprospiraceae bacterium]
MRFKLIATITCFFSITLNAQVGFYNGTSQVLGDQEVNSTICIGFEDLNGDLLEDLFVLDKGQLLKTFVQREPNTPFVHQDHLLVSANGDWAILSGDLDNDGTPEIISSGNESGSDILKLVDGKYVKQYGTENIFSQNTNLVDFNGDGFLDFFVCNDDGENLTYINDGTGILIQTKLIDFQTTPEDDMSGNYSSIFTDVDGDDDLDLYIGKCRANVFDPTDPRRINTLYINNGDGNYSEQGEEAGLAIGAQSWSVDSGDIDNDGDLDMIIANHDAPHDLMLNDGTGHFSRYTLIPDGYSSFAFQSFFQDMDNNGWLDIVITDPAGTYILFNEEMSFTRRDFLFGNRGAFSAATGDLNSDGFPDLYLSYAVSFQDWSIMDDIVLMNEGNTHNYLDLHLIGTQSNRDAVGAKAIVYTESGPQIREVVSGKSYGIMNTSILHYGLGNIHVVDSIKVVWPSGIQTIIKDIEEVNTIISITEQGCVTSIYPLPDLYLCGEEAIDFELPMEFEDAVWSNGMTGNNITIEEEGYYRVQFTDSGCLRWSSFFEVKLEEEANEIEVLELKNKVICSGEVIELSAYPGIEYEWSNGATTQVVEVTESGMYNVSVTTNCGEYVSDQVEVLVSNNSILEIENDTVLIGESATFVGNGNVLNWYQNKNDIIPLSTGETFTTPPLTEDQRYFVSEPIEGYGFDQFLMTMVPLNAVGDSIYTENEQVTFSVMDEILLKSFKVRTQQKGIRKFVLKQGDMLVYEDEIDLNTGINTISMNISLPQGIYTLGTDEDVNFENIGTIHPQFSYSQIYADKDKIISGYLEVQDSETYPGVTPYFFAWEIDYGAYTCEERQPIFGIIKMPVSTQDIDIRAVVYPNPTDGLLIIETEVVEPFMVEVLDMSGTQVMYPQPGQKGRMSIQMPDVAGIYLVKLKSRTKNKTLKVFVY